MRGLTVRAPERCDTASAIAEVTQQWITVALEEYKTLRQESLAAIEQMQRTLQIGLVAIGVLTAFGGNAISKGTGVQVGLVLATPLLAALVAALRLDELHRAVAAGAHAAELEQKIARRVDHGEPPLTWESRVQEGFNEAEDRIRHWATLLALFAAAAPAVALGIDAYHGEHEVWLVAGVATIFAVACWYLELTLRRVARLHRTAWFSISGRPQTVAALQG